MPIIAYGCECTSVIKKFVRKACDAPSSLICAICQKDMKRMLSAPFSTSKVTIDNGFQARAVEIHPDITEINAERSKKDYSTD